MIDELVERGVDLSQAVATVLADLERAYSRSDSGIHTDVDGLADSIVRRKWPRTAHVPAERASQLIAQAWLASVRPGAARRPDVLAITCDLLANPSMPWSRDIGRFAVTLGLRALYGVDYTTDALRRLRNAHSELQARFKLTRRRIRKEEPLESLIIDLSCLDGSVSRSMTGLNLKQYYSGFNKSPFGVSKSMRTFSERQEWPELRGTLPDFATITKLAFAQPTCIAGLDDVVQGLLASVPENESGLATGGLVSLVAGPPGSGKTSLCLTIAARMAELGSSVVYLATEEAPNALRAKLVSLADPNYLSSVMLGRQSKSDRADRLEFVDGRELGSFETVVELITNEVEAAQLLVRGGRGPGLYLPFPRVLVVDSLTALAHTRDQQSNLSTRRRELARSLLTLRDLGICVFLVGGPHDSVDEGLAYLVDNVFSLENEDRGHLNHRLRIFNVQKTRLQASYRGRHVMHLSRTEGFTISPSLHSITRTLHNHSASGATSHSRVLIAPILGDPKRHVSVRANSQLLIYGHGSVGKARFGLFLAFEPARPNSPKIWRACMERIYRGTYYTSPDADLARNARVLVVSFLYGDDYYHGIADHLFLNRWGIEERDPSSLTVLALYPGFLDPETLVGRIARALRQARLEGRPYTSVLIDGVHNMLVQFPLLQAEPLLWPALYRLLRSESVETISTYTFFRVPGIASDPSSDFTDMVNDSQVLFSHLLVSNCDYSMIIKRAEDSQASSAAIEVTMMSSLDGIPKEGERFIWDSRTFRPLLGATPRRR